MRSLIASIGGGIAWPLFFGIALFIGGYWFGYTLNHQALVGLKAETESRIEATVKARDSIWIAKLEGAEAQVSQALKAAQSAPQKVCPAPTGPTLIRLCNAIRKHAQSSLIHRKE